MTRIRRQRFVEFLLTVDEDLELEMVLPYREFRLFCRERDIDVLPVTPGLDAELNALATLAAARPTTSGWLTDQAGSR